MKRLSIILALALAVTPLSAQTRKQLKAENDTLKLRVASLEARLAAYQAIEEDLSGSGEN